MLLQWPASIFVVRIQPSAFCNTTPACFNLHCTVIWYSKWWFKHIHDYMTTCLICVKQYITTWGSECKISTCAINSYFPSFQQHLNIMRSSSAKDAFGIQNHRENMIQSLILVNVTDFTLGAPYHKPSPKWFPCGWIARWPRIDDYDQVGWLNNLKLYIFILMSCFTDIHIKP